MIHNIIDFLLFWFYCGIIWTSQKEQELQSIRTDWWIRHSEFNHDRDIQGYNFVNMDSGLDFDWSHSDGVLQYNYNLFALSPIKRELKQ